MWAEVCNFWSYRLSKTDAVTSSRPAKMKMMEELLLAMPLANVSVGDPVAVMWLSTASQSCDVRGFNLQAV